MKYRCGDRMKVEEAFTEETLEASRPEQRESNVTDTSDSEALIK